MSRGHVRQRGPNSWEVRWRADGKVCTKTVKGGKRAADRALTEALVAVDRGEAIAPSRVTVAAFLDERIAIWNVCARTRENYETSPSWSRRILAPYSSSGSARSTSNGGMPSYARPASPRARSGPPIACWCAPSPMACIIASWQ